MNILNSLIVLTYSQHLQDALKVREEEEVEGEWRMYDSDKKLVRRDWTRMVNSRLGSLSGDNLRQSGDR